MFGYLLQLHPLLRRGCDRDVAFLKRGVNASCHFETWQLGSILMCVYSEIKTERIYCFRFIEELA